jgi:hypothetical protein
MVLSQEAKFDAAKAKFKNTPQGNMQGRAKELNQ